MEIIVGKAMNGSYKTMPKSLLAKAWLGKGGMRRTKSSLSGVGLGCWVGAGVTSGRLQGALRKRSSSRAADATLQRAELVSSNGGPGRRNNGSQGFCMCWLSTPIRTGNVTMAVRGIWVTQTRGKWRYSRDGLGLWTTKGPCSFQMSGLRNDHS